MQEMGLKLFDQRHVLESGQGERMTTAPTNPMPYYTPQAPPISSDRSTRLMVFGILFLLGGALCALMTLSVVLAIALMSTMQLPANAARPQMQVGQMLGGLLVYGSLAVVLFWVGIGSIRKQRWVRPIVLSLGVLASVVGLITMLVMAILLPSFVEMITVSLQQTAARGGAVAPPQPMVAWIAMGISLSIAFVMMVLLPLIVTLFYWPQSVRETLEWYDPKARWTDACPLPVLGLAIKLGLVGVLSLPMAFYPAMPVGPFLIKGLPLLAGTLVVVAMFLTMAVMVYRQQKLGWWMMLVVSLVLSGILIWSGLSADWGRYLDAMQIPPDQRVAMNAMLPSMGRVSLITGIVFAVLLVGYAMSVKKYFVK
jgi:MFS family permease